MAQVMSGPRRLAIFLTVLWVVVAFVAYATDPVMRWGVASFVAFVPTGLLWGVWWVVQGFRRPKEKS